MFKWKRKGGGGGGGGEIVVHRSYREIIQLRIVCCYAYLSHTFHFYVEINDTRMVDNLLSNLNKNNNNNNTSEMAFVFAQLTKIDASPRNECKLGTIVHCT